MNNLQKIILHIEVLIEVTIVSLKKKVAWYEMSHGAFDLGETFGMF